MRGTCGGGSILGHAPKRWNVCAAVKLSMDDATRAIREVETITVDLCAIAGESKGMGRKRGPQGTYLAFYNIVLEMQGTQVRHTKIPTLNGLDELWAQACSLAIELHAVIKE
jgi:hypothetical protein